MKKKKKKKETTTRMHAHTTANLSTQTPKIQQGLEKKLKLNTNLELDDIINQEAGMDFVFIFTFFVQHHLLEKESPFEM